MNGFDIACLGVALLSLGLSAYIVLAVWSSAAKFHGSAARFQDAIENRALKIAGRGQVPQPQPEPGIARAGMPPMPEMPDVLKTRWKERTEGSNIPDTWQIPAEEV